MFTLIQNTLKQKFDSKLVDELLTAYKESKSNFYTGGLRLGAVEGGRFCEAAFRLLEESSTGKFTPLGRQLDVEKLIITLSNLPKNNYSDSIRLHIPRALRVVYDIRNNRDVAHLADGIDPNLQDSMLVISILDWVMAEIIRLYHSCSANDAQNTIENIVIRKAPAIQNFDGFLKVLRPKLKVGDYLLVLLYERGNLGASYTELENWIKPSMRANLRRTLHRLIHNNSSVHFNGTVYVITKLGMIEVEKRKLHQYE